MQRVSRSPNVGLQFYLYLLGTIRWAFVDFTKTEFATLVLTNPRNHSLDGRALVVEYASPDAARRSGGPVHNRGSNEEPSTKKTPNRASRRLPKSERIAAKSAKSGTKAAAAIGGDKNPAGEEARIGEHAAPSTASLHKHGPSPRSIRKAKRTKPGAALASAPRESGAIVASTGRRIIF
jgi:RNA recognition motif-containing protein